MRWAFAADDARMAAGMREAFCAYLRSRGAVDAEFVAAELIFGELVGNVVRHAPGPIEITVEWVEDRAVLTVSDRCAGFVPKAKPELPDVLSESGRGWFLLHAYGEGTSVRARAGGGSSVSVVLPVTREPALLPDA